MSSKRGGKERAKGGNEIEAQVRKFMYSVAIVRSSPHSVYLSRTLTEGKMCCKKEECSALLYVQDTKIYKTQRMLALLNMLCNAIIFSELWPCCTRSEIL